MSKSTDLEITQYQSDIQDYYKQNKPFLSKLPELDLSSESDLNELNKWLVHNQRNQMILDILVFNILPGVLTLGAFHLFYYLGTAIINFVKSFILKEKVSFHRNWTDHLTSFKNSKKAINRIREIQIELKENLNESNSTSESVDHTQTNTNSESESQSVSNESEAKQPSTRKEINEQKSTSDDKIDYLSEMLPIEKYPEVFKFLPLQALGKFANTSNANHGLVSHYFNNFDIKTPLILPKTTEQIEKALQFALDKSYTKLFVAIIRECKEPLLSKYLHPWLIKATEGNDIDKIKMILSIEDPITGEKFFDVNTPISPIMKYMTKDETILLLATQKGFAGIMRLCIEKGAKLTRSGRKQFGYAICSKNLECVKITLELLAKSYDSLNLKIFLNMSRMSGILAYELTALCEAIDHGTVEIAQLLINEGCDVNQDDHRGCPIKRALNTRNIDMFLLLLRNNYNIKKHQDFRKFILVNLIQQTTHISEWERRQYDCAVEMIKALSSLEEDLKEANIELPESLKESPEERTEKAVQIVVKWGEAIFVATENDDHPNIVFLRNILLGAMPKAESPKTLLVENTPETQPAPSPSIIAHP